jgi:hypothetical protein
MDSGFLAVQSPVPLKAVLGLGAAYSLPPMDIPPIDVPPVGKGLVHLGCPVHGVLSRCLVLRLRHGDAIRLHRRLDAHLHSM